MSTPQTLAHLLPFVDAPDKKFDELWDGIVAGNPDLQTPGNLDVPVEGLRSMMKLAWVAGKLATAEDLISE